MLATGKPYIERLGGDLRTLEMKAKEQQEALDNLIRQSLTGDTIFTINRPESSVQLFHWPDATDQQKTSKGSRRQEEGPGSESKGSNHKVGNLFSRGAQTAGFKFPETVVAFTQAARDVPIWWPIISNRIQVRKCEKCSQEFLSPLNYRRHIRAMHRRPLSGDKDDVKKKQQQIAVFWDKLTSEKADEILSCKTMSFGDLSADSVVQSLSAHLKQPGKLASSQSHVAQALLDIVQNKPSTFPLQSEKLFQILDEASEKNLLCCLNSPSLQRSIFDGEPGRFGMEPNNLVASLGFLLELRLVQMWMDDKDAEALQYQRELVEEEEAAQKKREQLQERRRQKKLRQKELKDREKKDNDLGFSAAENGELEGDAFSAVVQAQLSLKDLSTHDEIQSVAVNSSATLFSRRNDLDSIASQQKVHPGSLLLNHQVVSRDHALESQTDFPYQSRKQEISNKHVALKERSLSECSIQVLGDWRGNTSRDVSEDFCFERQQSGSERCSDNHVHGNQNVSIKGYSAFGRSSSDSMVASTGSKHVLYQEKYSGSKWPASSVGSHSFWTRKSSQRSHSVGQVLENIKVNDAEVRHLDDEQCSSSAVKEDIFNSVAEELSGALVIGSVTVPLTDTWATGSSLDHIENKCGLESRNIFRKSTICVIEKVKDVSIGDNKHGLDMATNDASSGAGDVVCIQPEIRGESIEETGGSHQLTLTEKHDLIKEMLPLGARACNSAATCIETDRTHRKDRKFGLPTYKRGIN